MSLDMVIAMSLPAPDVVSSPQPAVIRSNDMSRIRIASS
jgi:hypothetical protein